MKKKILPYLIILLVAILAATAVSTWSSLSNVSACVQAPGCVDQDKQPLGKLATHNYGFPATYKQVVTFSPVNSNEKANTYAGYAPATAETKSTSPVDIIANIIFWFALLYTCYLLAIRSKARS